MLTNRVISDVSWHTASDTIRKKVIEKKNNCSYTDTQLANILACSHNDLMGLYHSGSNITYSAAIFMEKKLGIDVSSDKRRITPTPIFFNSSPSSGFVYKIVGCDVDGMHRLNYKEGFIDIVSAIKEQYSLEYAGCRNEIFEQNIRVVDSRMDEILQNAILMQVGYLDGLDSSNIQEISKALAALNPIGVRNPEVFYEAKLKAFLFASFAGMTASKEWNGRKKLTGGYIDVDREGELLYYRAISDDIFENYLFKHTYVDRPDRGYVKDLAIAKAKAAIDDNRSLTDEEIFWIEHTEKIDKKTKETKIVKNAKKGDFGYVYQEGDDFYIAINFQIRFR